MASPGTEHEEAAAPVETKTAPSETAPATASPAAEVPPVQPSPPVEVPSAQPSPVDAPLLAAPLQGPEAAETALAPEAEGAPPPEPASTALSDEANEAAPLPLVRAAASSSPSLDAATRSRRFLAQFGPRPSAAWLAVAGVVAVVVFVAGVLTGRGLRSDPERRATSATAPSKAAAPASAAAPVAVAPTGDASPAAMPRPRMPATAAKSATGFNAQAAKLAIDRIVPRLKTCKQAGEPPGSATVTVTFAPTGRVSSAQVTTTRYAGTRTGNCIVQRLREARIPEFSGAPMTVKRSVAVR